MLKFCRGGVSQETVNRIARQLRSTRRFLDSRGRIAVMSKDEIKKDIGESPDYADSLAYCFSVKPLVDSAGLPVVPSAPFSARKYPWLAEPVSAPSPPASPQSVGGGKGDAGELRYTFEEKVLAAKQGRELPLAPLPPLPELANDESGVGKIVLTGRGKITIFFLCSIWKYIRKRRRQDT